MKRKIMFIVAAGVIILGIRYFFLKKPLPFYYAGTIEATNIDVPARLSTVVASVLVNEGDKVEQHQQLAQLECDDIKIQNSLAVDNLKRAKKLVKIGSLPRDAFEQISFRSDEMALRLSWCQVNAPIAGTVLTRFREPGEWVAPGVKLLSLANLDEVWAYIYVSEPLMAKLKTGMSLSGLLPELDMREVPGRIVKINEEAEFTPKNVQTREERTRLVFGIKIAFNNSSGVLKPGMPIEVDLSGIEHE